MFVWPTYSVFFWKKQTPLKAINCEPLPPQDPQVTVKGTSSILPDRPVGLSRRLCGSWYVCLDLLRTNIASCMVKLEAKKPFDPSGWTNQPLCSAVEFITPSQISSAKTAPENPAGIFPCHQWDPVGKICRRSEVSYSGLSSVSRLNQQISPVWACSMSLKVKKLTAGFPPRWRLMMLIYIYISSLHLYLPWFGHTAQLQADSTKGCPMFLWSKRMMWYMWFWKLKYQYIPVHWSNFNFGMSKVIKVLI